MNNSRHVPTLMICASDKNCLDELYQNMPAWKVTWENRFVYFA